MIPNRLGTLITITFLVNHKQQIQKQSIANIFCMFKGHTAPNFRHHYHFRFHFHSSPFHKIHHLKPYRLLWWLGFRWWASRILLLHCWGEKLKIFWGESYLGTQSFGCSQSGWQKAFPSGQSQLFPSPLPKHLDSFIMSSNIDLKISQTHKQMLVVAQHPGA